MKYTKIKITSPDYPKRLYRTIAVKGNPDLYTLGALIGTTLNAWFEHMYYFRNNESEFVPDSWLEFSLSNREYPMSQYYLSDLGEQFIFEYDTGEGYEFKCRIMKSTATPPYDYEEEPFAFVVDGKGQGIFENDHATLDEYLAGRINPKSSEEKETDEEWTHLPMNMHFEKYGDFDEPLDLEEMVYFEDEFRIITDHFKQYNQSSVEKSTSSTDIINNPSENMFLSQVAGDIFLVPFINDIFRELIKTYDINDAFNMIVDATKAALANVENSNQDFEDIHKEYLNNLLDHKVS